MAKKKLRRNAAAKPPKEVSAKPPSATPSLELKASKPLPPEVRQLGKANPPPVPPRLPTMHRRQNSRLSVKLAKWQKQQQRQWHRQNRWFKNIPASFWLLFLFFMLFVWVSFLQPSISPLNIFKMIDGKVDHSTVMGFLNVQVRTLGVILAAMFTLCAIAIPITASNYTPKLVNLFIKDVVNQLMFGLLILCNLYSSWTLFTMMSLDIPRFSIVAVEVMVMLCIALTVPYAYYVFRFLQPDEIIRLIENEILEDLYTVHALTEKEEVFDVRDKLMQNLKYLSNVILRSIDRSDRDTAFFGLEAFRNVFDGYFALKETMPDSWFRVSRTDFLTRTPELCEQIEKGKTFFEAEMLEELSLLHNVSMGHLRDVVRMISELLDHIGHKGVKENHRKTVELTYLYFNSFIRSALSQHNAESVYVIAYHYRRLAESVIDESPDDTATIAFYLDYYAHQAIRMGLLFIPNLLSYDVAVLTILAYKKNAPCKDRLLEIYFDFHRVEAIRNSPGVIKSHIKLATALHHMGFLTEQDRLCKELSRVKESLVHRAIEEIESVHSPDYWEITDRHQHLDYVTTELRPSFEFVKQQLLNPT